MNVNFENIRKTLLVTLLVVSASTFCVFPTTTSKYIIEKKEHLSYSVDSKPHTYSNITIEKNPDKNVTQPPKTIGFIATFDRSDYLKVDDEKVKYTFTVNKSACEITGTSPSSLFENSNKGNVATLTLNSTYLKNAKTKQVKVYYKCTADDIVEEKNSVKYLSTAIKVTEQFNDEQKVYTLGNQQIDYAYDLFYNLYLHFETDENGNKIYFIPKHYSASERYDLIINNFVTDNTERNYFYGKYPPTDKTKIENDQSLKGFVIGESADNNYYTYTKTKNYYNYAYTNKSDKLYFVNGNAYPRTILPNNEIVSLLKEYLYEDGSYYSKYTDDQKQEIVDYLEKLSPSIQELLEAKTSGSGKGIAYSEQGYVIIMDSIIGIIDANKPIEFSYTDSFSDIVTLMNNRVGPLYPKLNGNILAALYGEIGSYTSTTSRPEKYVYLGPFADDTTTLVVLLHQVPDNVQATTGKYYLTLYEVEKDKEYELEFLPTALVSDINLALDKFESENLIVSLGKNADNKDITEVTEDMLDRTGTLKITFTVVEKTISSYTTEDDSTKSEGQTNNETQENQENS